MENTRNADGIGKKEILVVSFGTSVPKTRQETIAAIEDAAERAFPDYAIRRGFTSGMIVKSLQKNQGLAVDFIKDALERAKSNGVEDLVIQPTHLMRGLEYKKMEDLAREYAPAFSHMAMGDPLLASRQDLESVIEAVSKALEEYQDGATGIVLLGHGSEDAANAIYAQIQDLLAEKGLFHILVGTVEAKPGYEEVLALLKKGGFARAILVPFMVVAGDHAQNDMMGEEEDSWKSRLEKEGFQVEGLMKGLGAYPEIQEIYLDHIRKAMGGTCKQ